MEISGQNNTYPGIKENLHRINDRIYNVCKSCSRNPADIRLIGVTKNQSVESIREAFDCGLRNFAENRVQETESKFSRLNDIRTDITLHMVGHLQSNKAGDSAELFDIIQSIDSLKLASTLNNKARRRLSVLLQVNIAGEYTKSGFSLEELEPAFNQIRTMTQLNVEGLMTIAPVTDDPELIRPVFARLREMKEKLGLRQLSMGMTDDFEAAIKEGSTMIRIGRAIFGERRQ